MNTKKTEELILNYCRRVSVHEALQMNVSVNNVQILTSTLALKSGWKIDSIIAGVKYELLSSSDVVIFHQIKFDKSVASVDNMLCTRSYRKKRHNVFLWANQTHKNAFK
jgi:hypothetical protein